VRMNVLTITNIAAGLLFFCFVYKTDTINAIGLFSAKGILKGLLLGLPIISYWIYCALEYASIWHLRKMPKGYQVLCVLLFVLSIGFNEELAMRGVVLPVLLRHWRDKKFGILYAVLLSSVSFGVLHYFQWHENAFQAALHVLGTTLVGMFYATVFLLTKNIWAAVIVHALYDFWLYLRYFVFYFSSSMSASREVNKLLGTSLIENGNTDWILAFVAILPLFITSVIYLTLLMKKKDI
ncbi:MAG: CPBP family intramembrane metalloprotease, partial [Lachnospiraceae bacterium]|nr:CPBP family intramembrane metalloprotease [Lachnospiraceae bacterium]